MGKRIINFIASGFYISYIPDYMSKNKGKFRGCGLFGTLIGFLFFPFIPQTPIPFLIFIIIFTFLSIYITNNAYNDLEKDNPLIVIDEICGYFWGFIFVENNVKNAIIIFVAFRIFDTLKPWPIKKTETISHKGIAIVLDDIVAGIYASLSTAIINKIIFCIILL